MDNIVLVDVGKHTYEMCYVISLDRQCSDCAAFGNIALCRKLPNCDGVYFRRLTGYEMKKLRKNGIL